MYVLALTGGLGSGKSTAAELFADRGATVVDLDDVAKALLDELPAVRNRVVEVFGTKVLAPDGRIDRAALASEAFASEDATERLDAIVHPAVLAAVAGALDTLATHGDAPAVVVLVVPLLAESPLFLELVDAVLAISALEEARIERAVARGMAREEAERRIARQAGDSERREIADYVIENDGDLETFKQDVIDFWDSEFASRES
ncbi:MAG: dephospho-CoA kinase [Coriobacteriia bacterium]|nr:dephospho-CoA kinase [Coriobacteriia bacterium]